MLDGISIKKRRRLPKRGEEHGEKPLQQPTERALKADREREWRQFINQFDVAQHEPSKRAFCQCHPHFSAVLYQGGISVIFQLTKARNSSRNKDEKVFKLFLIFIQDLKDLRMKIQSIEATPTVLRTTSALCHRNQSFAKCTKLLLHDTRARSFAFGYLQQ